MVSVPGMSRFMMRTNMALSAFLFCGFASLASAQYLTVVMLMTTFSVFGLVQEIFYQRIFWLAPSMCLALSFRPRSLRESSP
jgi:hypothetical protein